ncbi:unnamed protein product [Bursaphelenchus xylophilus]|uniref:(pine wood nematode) hypothetical protein n=1 Tax=Bursaphelenchus xylophilus TaxID=6326 RepID=A0A1I7S5I9_BURXY|nr:unnamed protein product [Bursaphelenchus xylophilus]CAG9124757.1 unnamed protein product [Bursaphelenchus xylophilus]
MVYCAHQTFNKFHELKARMSSTTLQFNFRFNSLMVYMGAFPFCASFIPPLLTALNRYVLQLPRRYNAIAVSIFNSLMPLASALLIFHFLPCYRRKFVTLLKEFLSGREDKTNDKVFSMSQRESKS